MIAVSSLARIGYESNAQRAFVRRCIATTHKFSDRFLVEFNEHRPNAQGYALILLIPRDAVTEGQGGCRVVISSVFPSHHGLGLTALFLRKIHQGQRKNVVDKTLHLPLDYLCITAILKRCLAYRFNGIMANYGMCA